MLIKSLQAAAGNAVPTDPNFEYVTMLLHGDGTNGAQNNTFIDSSTNAFTITRNGNTTQGTFSPYGSNWSNYFAYNSTAVNYLVSSSVSLSGTFTIEGYVYWDGVGSLPNMFTVGDSALSTGLEVYLSSGNWVVYSNGASRITSAAGVVGQWTYIAVTRSGSTVTLYINGVSQGTWTSSATFSGTIKVGAEFYSSTYYSSMSGYISNFRVNNTTAINSVPTAPLTAISGTIFLTCQGNRFVDNSASPLTITVNGSPSVQRFSPFAPTAAYSTATIGGSGYFDGSGDYLSLTMTGGVGSGDFTIEYWLYPSSLYNYITVFATNRASNGLNVGTQAAGQIVMYVDGSGEVLRGTTAMKANSWNHCAFTRSGTTLRGYLNGVLDATGTSSANFSQTFSCIGALASGGGGGGENTTGYISDLRVVSGTALYTGSTLTVPTAPLTAVSNTRLLTNFTNAGIIDNAMMNNLETVGNAQISTSVKKYGTGSLAFDGTGDWLRPPLTPQAALGSGDFTVEFWARVTDTGIAFDFCGTATWGYYIGAGKSGWSVSFASSLVSFSYQSNNSYVIATNFSGTGLSANTWYHIAIVRSSGVIKCYINGVASATTISSSANIASNTYGVWVGTAGDGDTYGYLMNGYIDDLRITKGYARYTANFTPPTAAFPNN